MLDRVDPSHVAYLVLRAILSGAWLLGCIRFRRFVRRLTRPVPRIVMPVGTTFLLVLAGLSMADGVHGIVGGPVAVRPLDWAWMLDDVLAPFLLLALIHIAWSREESFDRIERIALADQLTGLPNRHGFARMGCAALVAARRNDKPSAVLLMDLDRFKQINDEFGHSAGDQVLMKVADVLRASLRKGDVSLRYGGEEMAALLPAATMAEAAAVAERFRLTLPTCVRHPAGPRGRITASIGVAPVGAGDEQEALSKALMEADAALYRAKQTGRDRVECVS